MANRQIRVAFDRTTIEGLAATIIARAAGISIYMIALTSELETLGIDTTSLITALGSVGLTIGLALRNILSNLAAGSISAFNCSLRQGDIIEVNSVIGMVVEIDLLTTELKSSEVKKF